MSRRQIISDKLRLLWICTDNLVDKLDAGTWLETTRELRNLGLSVTLVVPGPSGRHRIRDVEVFCIPKPRVYLIRQAIFHGRILHCLTRELTRIDVVLFHQMSAPWLLPLRLVGRIMGRRIPLLVMDTRTLPMESKGAANLRARLRGRFYCLVDRLAGHWVDGQTAITRRMAEAVRIPPRLLWGIWPSGADPNLFLPAKRARRWPSPGEPVRLVYTGMLQYERNLMTLCRAVEEAGVEGMSFNLSLIGDGPQRSHLERFALRTRGRIQVVPPVPHDRVPGQLARAHVGVLPFPDEEKFRVSSPIKLFEYMAAGLPVLATRIACHTDVIGQKNFAFWAEDASVEGLLRALRLIWERRAHLRGMGDEAGELPWTWQESARKLRDALVHGMKRRYLEGHFDV